MNKKEERRIARLIDYHIPFVLFRAPGEHVRIIIQKSPLVHDDQLQVTKRGFYAFPFSENETAHPVYFSPDYEAQFDQMDLENIDLKKLPKPKKKEQNLYEVDKEEYFSDLNKFLEAFKDQRVKKAIYSRIHEEELEDKLDVERFFTELVAKYPKAFVYAMNIPGDGVWIGASPELLLSYEKGTAKTVALAGTLKINQLLSAPEWTRKEIDEHRLVEKYIITVCEEMDLDYNKSQVRTSSTGKVFHLKSDFDLRIPASKIRAFLTKLHPTPAISGLPQKESMELIYNIEKHDRSYYCGFLGYVESPENFNLYINLRCMKVVKKSCFLFSGGGITPESDIDKEWEETNVKMSTLTDLFEKDANHEEISSVSC